MLPAFNCSPNSIGAPQKKEHHSYSEVVIYRNYTGLHIVLKSVTTYDALSQQALHCLQCHSRNASLDKAEVRMSTARIPTVPDYPLTRFQQFALGLCVCVCLKEKRWVDAPGANPCKEKMCPKCCRISTVWKKHK